MSLIPPNQLGSVNKEMGDYSQYLDIFFKIYQFRGAVPLAHHVTVTGSLSSLSLLSHGEGMWRAVGFGGF